MLPADGKMSRLRRHRALVLKRSEKWGKRDA
jgi:hypothetical protein